MKGRRVRLSDAGVGKLKPDTTEYVVWDSEVPGLGVRVRPSGHRTSGTGASKESRSGRLSARPPS